VKLTILVQPYMQRHGGSEPLIGRSSKRFEELLERLREQMQFADRAGYHGMCMTEQHLQIEGIEVSTNPLIYDLFVAAHTSRLHVGQLGIPLIAHNPIKVAEDLALADHITGGRLFCGFSRGNTARWAETFAQHLKLTSATSDKSDADRANRECFYEAWEIVKRLWTEDTVRFDGRYWQVPVQTTHWEWEPTRLWGQGVDADGSLREIGIVPRPLQTPHPPVYAPFAFSMESARFWAREGGKLVSFVADGDFIDTTLRVYGEEAEAAGRTGVTSSDALALGGHLIIGRDDAEVRQLTEAFHEFYNLAYSTPPYNVPVGRMFAGTGAQVAEQLAELQERFDVDEFFLWHHVGHFDQDVELAMLSDLAEAALGVSA
jgi:alkanesulfonate monooxygenase SsuD/methylene tetrahydromethanopterin reductase-like flavin-dependent oxidoreductase (luciferase family)